jgi:hypothetical protein
LEELDSHIQSAGEPLVITVEFVDAKGTVVDRKDFTVNGTSPASLRTRPWRQK